MRNLITTALAGGMLAATCLSVQAADLTPLNSDSEPDRMDWSELETRFGEMPAVAEGTSVGGVSKTLTNGILALTG